MLRIIKILLIGFMLLAPSGVLAREQYGGLQETEVIQEILESKDDDKLEPVTRDDVQPPLEDTSGATEPPETNPDQENAGRNEPEIFVGDESEQHKQLQPQSDSPVYTQKDFRAIAREEIQRDAAKEAISNNNFQKAARHIEDAKKIRSEELAQFNNKIAEAKDESLLGDLYSHIADSSKRRDDYHKAVNYYLESIKLFLSARDNNNGSYSPYYVVRVYLKLGDLYSKYSNNKEANDSYQFAIDTLNEIDAGQENVSRDQSKAVILLRQARVSSGQSDLPVAEKQVKEAIELLDFSCKKSTGSIKDDYGPATYLLGVNAHTTLGEIYLVQNKFKAAETEFICARQFLDAKKSLITKESVYQQLVRIDFGLATSYNSQSDPENARAQYENVISKYEEYPDAGYRGVQIFESYVALAGIYRDKGNRLQSIQALERAIPLFNKLDDDEVVQSRKIIEQYHYLSGKTHWEQGCYPLASHSLTRGYDIFAAQGKVNGLRGADYGVLLASSDAHAGNLGSADVIASLQSSLLTLDALGGQLPTEVINQRQIAIIDEIGQFMAATNDASKHEIINESIDLLQSVRDTFSANAKLEEKDRVAMESHSNKVLGDLFWKKQDFDKALPAYRKGRSSSVQWAKNVSSNESNDAKKMLSMSSLGVARVQEARSNVFIRGPIDEAITEAKRTVTVVDEILASITESQFNQFGYDLRSLKRKNIALKLLAEIDQESDYQQILSDADAQLNDTRSKCLEVSAQLAEQ